MNKDWISLFLAHNSGCFDECHLPRIADGLEMVPDDKASYILGADFKKPLHMLLVSLGGGVLGIDRFVLGQTGVGIAKLLTCGGASIWTIVDLFLIMGETRTYNANKIIDLINTYSTKTERPSQDTRPRNPTEHIENSMNRGSSQTQYTSGSNFEEDTKSLPEQSSSSHAPGEENPYDYAPKSDYSSYAPKGYDDYTKNYD
ncbi:MAG: TM2 domain-containing protein [Paludibacteraceae bacterium]|nr:TM2 domain-containing protein [Paludibacteraceae bacterium]